MNVHSAVLHGEFCITEVQKTTFQREFIFLKRAQKLFKALISSFITHYFKYFKLNHWKKVCNYFQVTADQNHTAYIFLIIYFNVIKYAREGGERLNHRKK